MIVGWMPGLGNLINAGTAAAITESMGWLLVEELSKETQWAGESV